MLFLSQRSNSYCDHDRVSPKTPFPSQALLSTRCRSAPEGQIILSPVLCWNVFIAFPCRRWTTRLHHFLPDLLERGLQKECRGEEGMAYADELSAHLRQRFILCQGNIRKQRPVTDNRRVRVALDVRSPFPARGVWMACADKLGLETLKLLLGSQFISLAGNQSTVRRRPYVNLTIVTSRFDRDEE